MPFLFSLERCRWPSQRAMHHFHHSLCKYSGDMLMGMSTCCLYWSFGGERCMALGVGVPAQHKATCLAFTWL